MTILWNLSWTGPASAEPMTKGGRVSCVVYHGVKGMELRLESATAVILVEPFDMQPRSLARTKALRESLKRKGWKDASA
jgi:hypothetical protein